MAIVGYIDFITNDRVRGWAADIDDTNKPIALHLIVDGELVGHTLANEPREDLARSGLGDSAFSFYCSKINAQANFKVVAMPSGIELAKSDNASIITPDKANTEAWLAYEDPYVYPAQTNQFRSQYGGLWTDQGDALSVARLKHRSGQISDEQLSLLLDFIDTGILRMEKAISEDAIERYKSSLEEAYANPKEYQWINGSIGGRNVVRPLEPDDFHRNAESLRLIDFYEHNEAQRGLAFSDRVVDMLNIIFDGPVLAHQSLHFEYGSAQDLHIDTAFVRVSSPMSLVGVWYALEDVQPDSGELLYIPGSHRWPEHLFERRTKWMNPASNGPNSMFDHIERCAAERCVEPVRFLPKKGDVLFWANDLVHGGAKHDGRFSRKSLVVHYCSEEVEPMYFYYGKHSGKVAYNDKVSYASPQKILTY